VKKFLSVIIILLFLSTIFTGCSSKSSTGKAGKVLRIGLLQDVDSLPFIVAQENGYFSDEGVTVELQVFKSAPERDSAFQSGNVDGVVSDMLAAIFAKNGGFDAKITSHTDGRYIFLASKQSGAKNISDLKNGEIGLSKNTIIEYSVDTMLKNAGLNPDSDVKKDVIPQMPVRLEMLKSGQITAACLPDPLATMAEKDGAVPVGDTGSSGTTLGVMLFSQKSIDEKKDEIKRAYNAYERAKEELNKNGDRYRPMLVEKAGFPEPVKDIIKFPEYRKSALPSKNDFESAYKWMKEKGLVDKDIDYDSIVSREFLK
jgi:NitT/TauT family transport system substrate-binding protein